MNREELAALIRERLTALDPLELVIEDESDRHAGHREAAGGAHFKIRIVSRAFEGQTTLHRHRQINTLLADLLQGPVHALGLKTFTPDEFQ